ncbi:uncharacterized protein LOC143222783 isoform X2 [Tachypleus tridentatus]|uniref:uncharacterized protein LOC143222783 isoform X2 n=1 Tax=Tachypleus tridentatus TaxID=6853 RepID=UPI003FD3C939
MTSNHSKSFEHADKSSKEKENLLRKYKNLPLSFPHVYKTSRDLVRIEEKLLRILSQEKNVLSPDCTGYCVTSKQNGEVVWEMQDLHVKVKKEDSDMHLDEVYLRLPHRLKSISSMSDQTQLLNSSQTKDSTETLTSTFVLASTYQ